MLLWGSSWHIDPSWGLIRVTRFGILCSNSDSRSINRPGQVVPPAALYQSLESMYGVLGYLTWSNFEIRVPPLPGMKQLLQEICQEICTFDLDLLFSIKVKRLEVEIL